MVWGSNAASAVLAARLTARARNRTGVCGVGSAGRGCFGPALRGGVSAVSHFGKALGFRANAPRELLIEFGARRQESPRGDLIRGAQDEQPFPPLEFENLFL